MPLDSSRTITSRDIVKTDNSRTVKRDSSQRRTTEKIDIEIELNFKFNEYKQSCFRYDRSKQKRMISQCEKCKLWFGGVEIVDDEIDKKIERNLGIDDNGKDDKEVDVNESIPMKKSKKCSLCIKNEKNMGIDQIDKEFKKRKERYFEGCKDCWNGITDPKYSCDRCGKDQLCIKCIVQCKEHDKCVRHFDDDNYGYCRDRCYQIHSDRKLKEIRLKGIERNEKK